MDRDSSLISTRNELQQAVLGSNDASRPSE